MIKQIQAVIREPCFKLAAIVCALTACVPGLEKKQARLDTASIKKIEFKVGTIKQSTLASTLHQQNTIARISKNLADWGYPIAVDDKQTASHTLTAEIGLIERGETPAGFSFSAGNSDPRAIDFQKIKVLPISCELASLAQPEQTVYLHMEFAAGDCNSGDKLVDHISTVCFNLLSELDWPDKMQNQPSSSSQPNWVPEVRIETIASPDKKEKTGVPAKTVTSISKGRKQIVIHNQGTPVIFSFGHERR